MHSCVLPTHQHPSPGRFVIIPDMLKQAPMFKRIDPKVAKQVGDVIGLSCMPVCRCKQVHTVFTQMKGMPIGTGGRGRGATTAAPGRGRGGPGPSKPPPRR